MRLSQGYWQTYKEIPSDAETISHQLMLRAGLIYKSGQGLYAYLPMGLRVLRKIETIVREELNKAGCHELQMPMVTSADLWKETGRWEKMGDLMLKALDRGKREVCLSPTNEEALVDIFRHTVTSYKSLPVNLYQIHTKFRDEIRPRFGVMRAREFLMKDGYSFHMDKACLQKEYENMYQAYSQIFKRSGLEFISVEADGGVIAGAGAKTHEFQVVADSGEDYVIQCPACGYAANVENAQTKRESLNFDKAQAPLTLVDTPNAGTIEQVCTFLKKEKCQSLKSLVYTAIYGDKEKHFLFLLLGDDELNEVKLQNFLKADHFIPSKEVTLSQYQMPAGFIGPYGLNENVKVYYDSNVDMQAAYSIGALQKDKHYVGFIPSRDDSKNMAKIIDLRKAQPGDACFKCGQKVVLRKGIEVGHIFELGDKYTKSMNVTVLDANGKNITPLMGTYGIGVSRMIAAAIEQNHDTNGIVWPSSLAPYQIYFTVIAKDPAVKKLGEKIYQDLLTAGYEVLFDDRDISPGIIFKDSDLLGLPVRILLGERDYLKDKTIEIKERKTGKVSKVSETSLLKEINQIF